MIHKETNVASKMKIVISLLFGQFEGMSAIDSAIRAIDYAGKKNLRLRDSITGTGVIMGNVMILDVDVPLGSTNSSDVTKHYDAFNADVVNYLSNGIYHRGHDTTYGAFGGLSLGYVSPEAVRDTVFTVRVKTTGTAAEVRSALADIGEVQDVRDGVGRFV